MYPAALRSVPYHPCEVYPATLRSVLYPTTLVECTLPPCEVYDFWEPFGGSHSWRVVDEDHHRMPVKGAMYSVVAWLQQDTTGKFGVAIGTWQDQPQTELLFGRRREGRSAHGQGRAHGG